MRRRIGELEEESRRAQTTLKQIRNEREEPRQFENTLHRANDGLRRSVLKFEVQAVGAPSSWGEERQKFDYWKE